MGFGYFGKKYIGLAQQHLSSGKQMISGLNHITFSVRDLEQSFSFYSQVLGFKPVAKWYKGAYLLAGDDWIALILDQRARETSLPEYTHIGFTVSQEDFEAMCDRIKRSGAEIWQDNRSEGDSLYFLDPNGHKLEIHASDLATRIKTAKENPWAEIEFFV